MAKRRKRRSWGTWAKLLAPVALSICGLVLLRLLGPELVDQQRLREWIAPFGRFAPIAFVLILAARPFTFLPGQLFTAVGGLLFGATLGTAYALVGAVFANALVYVLARRFGRRLMRRATGDKFPAVESAARAHGFKFGLATCLNPLMPTDVMIAAASASGARFWPILLGVTVGNLPGTFLTAQFGSALGQGRPYLVAISAIGVGLSVVVGLLVGRHIAREIRAFNGAEPGPPSGPAEREPKTPSRPPGFGGSKPAHGTAL